MAPCTPRSTSGTRSFLSVLHLARAQCAPVGCQSWSQARSPLPAALPHVPRGSPPSPEVRPQVISPTFKPPGPTASSLGAGKPPALPSPTCVGGQECPPPLGRVCEPQKPSAHREGGGNLGCRLHSFPRPLRWGAAPRQSALCCRRPTPTHSLSPRRESSVASEHVPSLLAPD